MENEKYLSEERYQCNNQKVKKVGKVLLICGAIIAIIGLILLIIGVIGTGNSVKNGFNGVSDTVNSFNSLDSNNQSDVVKNTVDTSFDGIFGSAGLIILGSIIISVGSALLIAGGIVLLISHRREITAYTTQQVMPIAQEGIEKMTPTISTAMGTIGKEFAKGVKEGMNEADKSKEQ